jgi:hypothetical protein
MTSSNEMTGVQQQGMNPRIGLCSLCAHARRVTSSREAEFWLCGRSATDPRFPKYPTLPVRQCAGYEPEGAPPVS